MAPKAAVAAKGAKGKGKDGADEGPPQPEADSGSSSTYIPPTNMEEVLKAVNLDGLPHCPTDEVMATLKDKYEQLVAVFVQYCKLGSECATIAAATRLKLAGFRKLVKDANLELKVFDFDAMSRLFAQCSPKGGGGVGGGKAIPNPETVDLGMENFLTLLVTLAFCRDNPRYVFAKESAGKKEETVPVIQCVQMIMNEFLPRMDKGTNIEFRTALKSDVEAQGVVESYSDKIKEWLEKLSEKSKATKTDMYTQFTNFLNEKGCLGTKSIEVTDAMGLQVTHKSELTILQARHAFLSTQDPKLLAVGQPVYDLPSMLEALARCGEKKYSAILQMSFASRVRAMLQNVLGQATEMEVITEAVASEANADGAADFDEKVKEAQRRNWLVCWKNMTFKDLHGFPLWETQLHDVLQASFPELQSIFLHYCGSSIAGSESIGSATRVGLMEFLTIAKDTDLCTKEFKVDEVTRHFTSANAQTAIANSGSSDRNKLKTPKTPKVEAATSRKAQKAAAVDAQLNLFEFINLLVRVAFWRANPQWGSKYNKKDLTPVPESTQILLEECILPKAKRDTSGEFKKVLASDASTQAVLGEYREKLQNWLRPILRKERTTQNPNPQMTYLLWVALMDGPDSEQKESGKKPPCPKMVGEWSVQQESQITGDERTSRKNQITFKAALSIPQCRWNFLRSQTIEQVEAGDVDAESSAVATLDFSELGECIARCAVNMYEHLMKTFLPSHDRKAMTMADATRSFLRNLLSEKTPEMCMWEATVIKADRYDWQKQTKMLPGFSPAQHKLWLKCWSQATLIDVHHFPLWEKGVHDTLQQHFPALMRIFSHYSKGISGVDSVADALEMELEEFHDFVKDAKLETRMINFTTMSIIFAKANATNTMEAFEQRMRERRNATVVAEQEVAADKQAVNRPISPKKGAFPDAPIPLPKEEKGKTKREGGEAKKTAKPDNRLTLSEFLGCLVRISFMRANPKHGQYDNISKLVELPSCLRKMLEEVVIPNAKQDQSSLFREELLSNAEVQAAVEEYRERLVFYYNEVNQLTALKGKTDNKLSMETWMDVCRGYLHFSKTKGSKHMEKARTTGSGKEGGGLGEGAFVGDCTVSRESDITGDERCREKFTCRLSTLEAKFAFLNSQSLEQMSAGDATEDDAMATLDFEEFLECLCRCARDKYGEIKLMSLADGVRGVFMNILGEKTDEAVIRDATYIHAERFDWKLAKPLNGQSLAAHRKWIDCWQNISIADLHYFPLWEKDVFEVMQAVFPDLTNIFAHYAKSIGGSTTAEDAVEMTMSEFKDFVKDVSLETQHLRFDVMMNMFKKANATNSNEAHFQRKAEQGTAAAKEIGSGSASKTLAVATKTKSAASQKDTEMDAELVLYEFVEVLIRISFWRANPYHGIHKLATKLIPLPDCLVQMLQEVVLPNAKRDDSALFKEKLKNDKPMQEALDSCEASLKIWFEVHTQSMFLQGKGRKMKFDQWQELLKKGWGQMQSNNEPQPGFTPPKQVGSWQIYQDSEITGDERCRNIFKVSLSMPQAKFAFIDSQNLDQLGVGQQTADSASTTLEFDEFKECIARCALEKYAPIKQMSPAAQIINFVKNLLGTENTEECLNKATLIKAQRYQWKRYSQPLPDQTLKEHKKWLEVWQRLEISDIYYFPLWEKGVHDLLQKHFNELTLIFLAYCRSLLGSDTAEDAMEMEMSEFHDFVVECGLETKHVSFDLMTNMFIKANATNSAAVRDQHAEGRRSAETKMDHLVGKGDTLATGRTTKVVGKVKGTNDGKEAKKDAELVLYEFMNLLVRIAFQRANPTFGNFGDQKPVKHLPGCLRTMLEDEILPRARKDTSAIFREKIMSEMSVLKVLDDYRPKLDEWYKKTCADDTKQTTAMNAEVNDVSSKLQMAQWLSICADPGPHCEQDLVGTWECYRQSDVTGDPACKTKYMWRLSMAQVKMAFMDSQPSDSLGVGQSNGNDAMAVLDFDEFLECCARLGVDKYRAVKEVSPAQAVKGFIQNLLNEKSADEVVIEATYIHVVRYDSARDTRAIKGESQKDLEKWLACWDRMTIMDVHLWPTWEQEVHDILHPLFKELQLIFLAYTRSISEDSAEDAMEMSMDEFHDFVVDVGLETKKYKFEMMQNQFIKANATNVAQVRAQRQDEKRDPQSKMNDVPEWKKKPEKKLAGKSNGEEAKKDAELVLYEFLNMLVRIAFWRANPDFGLWKDKDNDGKMDKEEVVPVAFALSNMLNEVILPRAKRENSAAFRSKEMQDPKMIAVLDAYKPKLKEWYDKKVLDDSDQKGMAVSDKIGFQEWLRVLDRQDIVGEWEVEQMSEITGDESTKGVVRCRLSIPTCKAAFMDSQNVEQLGVAQADATSEQSVLDFDEWLECLARIANAKYQSIKQMDPAAKAKAFLQNFFGEKSEEECMREATYIRAVRYDISDSVPLKDESPEEHAAFLSEFKRLDLQGLYGFPLWEAEVHDLLHANFRELASIFRAYCKSVGEAASDESSKTMDIEEFHDFVVDVGLETRLQVAKGAAAATYTFEQMKGQFSRADKSGKGLAGPAANAELVLYEFLNVVTRVSFYRLNPEFGELTMEHQDSLLPVPQCLEQTLREAILPKAHRDDAAEFRVKTMQMPEVVQALNEARPRLQAWYASIPLDDNQKVGMSQWIGALETLNVIGTFTCMQGSDIVGDDRVGTEFKCRLSVPQAKAAFVNGQKEVGGGEDVSLDFEELLECIARCGVDKYRPVNEITTGGKVAAMVANILGDLNEEQVIKKATYIHAERYEPQGDAAWVALWRKLNLSTLPGFPLWEKQVHAVLHDKRAALASIFRAYSASSLLGSATDMDMEEFHDFVIEANLITDKYGFDTMVGQFTKANAGSNDDVLELHEFLTMLVRISFFRANPQYGMRKGKDQKNADQFATVPLPDCLIRMLSEQVIPNARDEEYSQRFVDKILPLSEVQSALSNNAETIQEMFEMYSEGRDFLEIDQWIKALESKMLISNVKVHGYQVRLTEPQVKAAFYASAATPSSGITPEELPALIARCGYDKYRNVAPMGAGAKVDAFMQNLLGKADEEDVIAAATGGGTVPSFQGAHESVPKRSSKEAVEEEEEEEEEYEEEEEDVDDEE